MKSISSVILAIVMALFAQVVAAETTSYIDDYREVAMAAINKSASDPKKTVFYTAEGQFYAAQYCKEKKDRVCHGLNEEPGLKIVRAYIKAGSTSTQGNMFYFDYFPEGKKILDGKMDRVFDSSNDSPFVPNADLMKPPTKADQAAVEKTVRILADAIRRKVAK